MRRWLTLGLWLVAGGLFLVSSVGVAQAGESRALHWRPAAQEEGQDLLGWWRQLPDNERRMLQRDRRDFPDLPPEQQQRIRQRWERYQQMTPAERDQLRDRYERWQNMRPEEREQLRQTYRRFKQLPPRERQDLKRELRDLRDLPAEQQELRRRELRQRYFRDAPGGSWPDRSRSPAGNGPRNGGRGGPRH